MSQLDAIIIGSGFGGSFTADHLVEAGLRVAVVERGPWRDTQPVRAAGIQDRTPLPHKRHMLSKFVNRVSSPHLRSTGIVASDRGLYDVHLQRDMTTVCTSSVGGGSHVYTAMNVKPAVRDYWDNRAEGLDHASMDAIADRCIARMGARVPSAQDNIPNFIGNRFGEDSPFEAHPEQPAMAYNLDTGPFENGSFFGCENGAKVTLDTLLLAPAMRRGMRLYDLHEVVDFHRDGTGHWTVTLLDRRDYSYRQLSAPKLILAAGTVNTLRLLFSVRDRGALGGMPALGLGFGGNGDTLAYWLLNDRRTDYSTGSPCHGRFNVRGKQDGPNLTSYGISGVDQLLLPRDLREWLKHGVLVVGMGADEANGQVTWRKGRMRFTYSAAANPTLAATHNALDEVTEASGKRVFYFSQLTLTVHPLGGARVHGDRRRGVVNGYGEVHDMPGLYVADAAAFPAAPGAPPSMSIATWATHVAQGIVGHG